VYYCRIIDDYYLNQGQRHLTLDSQIDLPNAHILPIDIVKLIAHYHDEEWTIRRQTALVYDHIRIGDAWQLTITRPKATKTATP
jgi:hypothetical protein